MNLFYTPKGVFYARFVVCSFERIFINLNQKIGFLCQNLFSSLNCGSSSLKFAILDPATGEEKLSGLAEAFYLPEARIKWKINGEKGSADLGAGAAHTEALNFIASNIMTDELKTLSPRLVTVSFTVVRNTQSVVVTDEVVKRY